MINNVQIRQIEQDDLNFIYDCINTLEEEILPFDSFKEIFLENINNPAFRYFIAESGRTPLGFISIHTQNLLHHCGLVGEIQEFYILPEYRNKGIGKLLIDQVMKFARETDLQGIDVTTNKKRIENIKIYENLGFNLTHNKFTIKLI